jgi:hypothetical protein
MIFRTVGLFGADPYTRQNAFIVHSVGVNQAAMEVGKSVVGPSKAKTQKISVCTTASALSAEVRTDIKPPEGNWGA